MLNQLFDTVWGQATQLLTAPIRRRRWVDLLVIAAFAGLVAALVFAGRQWTGIKPPTTDIVLTLGTLPKYAFFTLVRAGAAYALSLSFALVVAYWAAKDPFAERLLIPLLDILQSIPLLAFMPAVLLTMITIFPHSNMGLELSAVILIFTSQAWNMAFSFYQSLKTLPADLEETARLYDFSWWERLRWVELPYATPALVWNSMVSVANGWFFLMVSEIFKLGNQDFRLPGLGSFVAVAAEEGNVRAQLFGIATMLLLVVLLDQLLWKPIVAWSQRFQMDDSAAVEKPTSFLLQLFRRSRLFRWLEVRRTRRMLERRPEPRMMARAARTLRRPGRWVHHLGGGALLALLLVLSFGAFALVKLLMQVSGWEYLRLLKAGGISLSRVLLSTLLSTLWTVPVGLAIGLSPKLSKRLQPLVQVVASFPATILFPTIIVGMMALGLTLNWTSVFLFIMGTQWYLLFNIIAGAQAVPQDLREASEAFHMSLWQKFRNLYLPAIFPYLVTGWVTATGGAWNASIVSEFFEVKGRTFVAFGLGSEVALAAKADHKAMVAASAILMALIVVLFNRLVWAPLYRLAEDRYALHR